MTTEFLALAMITTTIVVQTFLIAVLTRQRETWRKVARLWQEAATGWERTARGAMADQQRALDHLESWVELYPGETDAILHCMRKARGPEEDTP